MNLHQFISRHGITAEAVMVDNNPNMPDDPKGPRMDHWRVTLKRPGHRMTVPFSMGPALAREPTAADVLECMASDASSADLPFEDWCGEYGYDTDSRKAERTYRAVKRQTEELRTFVGPLFPVLLYELDQD